MGEIVLANAQWFEAGSGSGLWRLDGFTALTRMPFECHVVLVKILAQELQRADQGTRQVKTRPAPGIVKPGINPASRYRKFTNATGRFHPFSPPGGQSFSLLHYSG